MIKNTKMMGGGRKLLFRLRWGDGMKDMSLLFWYPTAYLANASVFISSYGVVFMEGSKGYGKPLLS